MSTSLSLAFDLRFEDLYGRDGLVRLDGCFVDFLKRRNVELHNRLMAARAAPDRLAGKEESDLIVELAPELEDFVAALFGIARETEVVDGAAMLKLPPEHRRARDGFALTDPGTDLTGALDHANYCIWCHNQGKDSCSKGLKEKSGEFKKSAFGVVLAGCPLDEKISEMNLVEV